MRVMVLDGQYITALATIRALARSGAQVDVGAAHQVSHVLGFASRYASARHRLPDARRTPDDFRRALAETAADAEVVFPCGLASVTALAGAPEWEARTLLPAHEALQLAVDKARVESVARELGICVPHTFGSAEAPRFPAVVKYRHGEALGLPPEQRYAIVRSPGELAGAYARMSAQQADPVVQEWLPGEGRGCSAICSRGGEPVAFFCHRRLREYPAAGGPSTWAESIEDPRLVALTRRLLTHLRWRGHAMVEYKLGADGQPRLLEINPRPWGTYPLAVAAGMNFPAIYCALVTGQPPRVAGYRTGVRLRFWAKDVLSARSTGMALPVYLAGAVRAPGVPGVFDPTDPLPSLVYAARLLSRRHEREAGDAA